MKITDLEMKEKIIKRFKLHNIKFKDFDEIIQKLKIDLDKDLVCNYCGDLLKSSDNYPYLKVVSLDHKIPIINGGLNEFNNVCLCCVECNIVKGTMTENTFRRLLEILNNFKNDRKQIFSEIFKGRFANKMERL